MFYKKSDRFHTEQIIAGLLILIRNLETELQNLRNERTKLAQLTKEIEKIIEETKPKQTYV